MGAYTTLAIDEDKFNSLISTIKSGYTDHKGVTHRQNERLATALVTEFNLGIRISDIVKLSLSDIVSDGNHYRLDIVEKKTGKPRTHTVNSQFYNYLKDYCARNRIQPTARMFPFSERAVQKSVKAVAEFLELDRISTHSFRKAAANDIYESTGHDIEMVREFLQHASATTTQAYIKRSRGQLEKALSEHVKLL